MIVIATIENQINVNEDSLTKKVIAFAHATKTELNIIDVCKTKITGTEWAELASKANLSIADFIQTEHPIYTDIYKKNSVTLDDESAIKILHAHPEVLVYPIALRKNKAVLCKTESDLLQLQSSDTGEVPIP
jgi:arsenate reductase-like glutaredoxin family protein